MLRAFSRFAGDTEPLSPKMWRRADPNIFRWLVTGEFPSPRIVETPEELEARRNSGYTDEERDELVTPNRRRLLLNAGRTGREILELIDSGFSPDYEIKNRLPEQGPRSLPTDSAA